MSSTTVSSTSTANLNSTFTTLVNNIMTAASQPLTALNTKKDSITVQQAVYSDLTTDLTGLQSAVNSLLSSSPTYSFSSQRKTDVSNTTNNSTVLTASAGGSAVPAQYQIAVTSLAKAEQVYSDQQAAAGQDLNFSGSFMLEGNGTSSINTFVGINDTVNTATTGSVASGLRELGTGSYYVETRQDGDGNWQFRMVDSSGSAVSILQQNGSYSGGWQSIPTGDGTTYDTGRGIVLNFGSDPSLYQTKSKGFGAAQIDYQAKGTEIDVSATDSLADIVSSINNATYAQGDEVVATILDNQLVLSRKATGAGNNLTAYDVSGNILNQLGVLSGTGFKNVMQTPTDAVFTVNNIQISRSQNTGLTDVIQGVTLNLATDAEGQSATLAVADDSTSETSVLNTFINKFNTVVSYLTSKTAVTKQSDGTYSRGALAGDSMFQSLRLALVQEVNGSAANSGIYKSLNDIGLSLDDNFSLSISDSTKLKEALSENKSDVMKLLDGVMSKMQTTLSNYVGNSGYVNTLSTSLSSQLDQTNNRITDMTKQLTAKQQALVNQYANIQSELQLMTYEEQEFETIYSTLTSTTTSA